MVDEDKELSTERRGRGGPYRKGEPNPHAWKKGVSGNPGGRKALDPVSRTALAAAGPDAIARLIALTSCGDEKVALAACCRVIEIVYGKDPMRAHVALGGSDANRLRALEHELHRRAVEGDTTALLAALRALAPDRYGPPRDSDGLDGEPTTVRIVPLGAAREGHRPGGDDDA